MALLIFLSAIIPRLVFILHTLLAVWRVTTVKENQNYWLLTLLILLICIEMIVTLKIRKGKDYKGFSPAIFFYLINIIPSIWILEVNHFQWIKKNKCSPVNESSHKCLEVSSPNDDPAAQQSEDLSSPLDVAFKNIDDWTLALHQALLILLILGKWLLPMGAGITRDQLSQLLLMFVGIAADILEFSSETLAEKGVRCNSDLVFLIMAVWTWSMLQFPLDVVVQQIECQATPTGKRMRNLLLCKHSADLWNICISIFIQDGPFLFVRLYLMLKHHVINQMLAFFAVKNALVLILQVYRLVVIYLDIRESLNSQQQNRQRETNCCPCDIEDTQFL
ncbi:transmembrane protein 26b [Callorhinchus milii]|nr:transmembrane protein 26b [Callorhinchus milii]|eukprot:gi/632936563/ref/XP_007895337.1/ PREDICTED: transmembrane protein 26 isoform X1 [Callorhinchus milii]